MRSLSVRTAAKVNLCLRVLGRRPDGFHEVETVMHTIGLWDRLQLADDGTAGIHVCAAPAEAPQGEDNLCWQAASVLAEYAKVKRGATITVEKTIPMRSGLGGGSSDAAATIAGLTRLWQLNLGQDEMEGLGAQIGADVPFFLRGGCCLARGKGERLAAAPAITAWFVLVVPERRVATAQAYAALQRGVTRGHRRAPSRPIQKLLSTLETNDIAEISSALQNDFESVPMAGVADALLAKTELLEAGCVGALMSGSGSSVCGLTESRDAAAQIATQLEGRWPWVAIAPTISAGDHLEFSEETSD
ncbi:MAG: 4-(cytidine 5'-diphospho)-2-C-methyl-D-erythritol kinase [Armatimonadetes bacterium]|nr:4-(cytidine 5'-diphospho)-2-C-methyl-D-erythritol kinase [Armatimonadota bacterium]